MRIGANNMDKFFSPAERLAMMLLVAIESAIQKKLLPGTAFIIPEVTWCKNQKHGDYQTNVCFVISKNTGIEPMKVGEILLDEYARLFGKA